MCTSFERSGGGLLFFVQASKRRGVRSRAGGCHGKKEVPLVKVWLLYGTKNTALPALLRISKGPRYVCWGLRLIDGAGKFTEKHFIFDM